jgi:hypothetical protein
VASFEILYDNANSERKAAGASEKLFCMRLFLRKSHAPPILNAHKWTMLRFANGLSDVEKRFSCEKAKNGRKITKISEERKNSN